MNKIILRVPATCANVGPGYDIFSLALSEPYDTFEIIETEGDKIRVTTEAGAYNNIPVKAEDNSGSLAILELFRRKNLSRGVDIKIIKGMPSGCGLGTTGATASACIYGMNRLLDLRMRDNEMIDIARYGEVASGGSPHADNVASAFLGGFVLIKSYKPMDVLKINIPEISVVLGVIKKSMKTTRGFITYEIGPEKLKEQMAHCSSIIHSLHTKDAKTFGRAVSVDHIAEPVRAASIPGYWEIKRDVLAMGAYGFTIIGGGSSVMALCDSSMQDEISELFKSRFTSNPNFIKVIKTTASNKGIEEINESGDLQEERADEIKNQQREVSGL